MKRFNKLRLELLERKEELDRKISGLQPDEPSLLILYIKRKELVRILDTMKSLILKSRKRPQRSKRSQREQRPKSSTNRHLKIVS